MIRDVYGDSAEIADMLRRIAKSLDHLHMTDEAYWLMEAAVHIEGMYSVACELELEARGTKLKGQA